MCPLCSSNSHCNAECFLVTQPCEEDSDCCDSKVNVSCQYGECTKKPNTCGSNQVQTYDGKCSCKDGFINVDRIGGVFCVPGGSPPLGMMYHDMTMVTNRMTVAAHDRSQDAQDAAKHQQQMPALEAGWHEH
jgi:hypothetical protein